MEFKIDGVLQNSWQGSFKYTKNDLGIVSIEITAYGTVVAGNTVIVTLPLGYKPRNAVVVNAVTDLLDGIQTILVKKIAKS